MKKVAEALSLLTKIAITWDEYSTAHPKTKKTPADPLFTKEQQAPVQKTVPTPATLKTIPKKPTKPRSKGLTDDEILEKYKPQFVKTANQREFSKAEIQKLTGVPYGGGWDTRVEMPEGLKSWTADDFAWQMMNGKHWDEFAGYAHDHIAAPNVAFLKLQNPNVPRKEKDETAYWLLDKGGVSFVAGKSMPQFIQAMAKKGMLSKGVLKAAVDNKTRDDLYYNGITDPKELRKFDIEEWGYQLLHNQSLPTDVLLKMLNTSQSKLGIREMARRGVFSIGSASGPDEGKVMSAVNHVNEILSHSNFPASELFKVLDKYMLSPENEGARKLLLSKADLPEDLRKIVFKYMLDHPSSLQLPKFKVTPSEFSELWSRVKTNHVREMKKEGKNSQYATTTEYALRHIVEHESCTDEALKDVLAWKLRQGNEGKGPISAVVEAKTIAYKKAVERGLLSDKDISTTVSKNLNLHGDMDLIRQIGVAAYTSFPVKNSTSRNFTKVSSDEKAKIQEYMKKTSFHEDFDFDVVNVWEVDKEPHKDFPKMEKKINHVIKSVYHGTTFGNAGGVLTDGVRVGGEERTGSMFGEGFYITSASSKAAQYASDNFSHEEGEGIVFVLDAAMGNTQEMKFGRSAYDDMKYRYLTEYEQKKQKEYEAKTGKKLKTKWHLDHDSVTAKAGMSLDYDEYVVKDGSQVQVKRIVHIRKRPKI